MASKRRALPVDFSMWIWPYARWGGFDGIAAAARRIEQLGFAGITVSDHVVSPTGPEGEGLQADWPDWAVTAAHLATVTERLRIVASVAIPYRHPLSTAKQVATLDQLSGGRFTLAACVGWWEHEFEMLGVPFRERGAVTDEYLDAMRVVWTQERPEFAGRYVQLSQLRFEPRCRQRPHVPIWIAGGSAPRVLERLWRVGDGWMPMGDDDPVALGTTIARIKEGAAQRGRDPERLTFRYTIGIGEAEPALGQLSDAIAGATDGPGGSAVLASDPRSPAAFGGAAEQVAASIARYAQAGFTELAINPAGDSAAACMERIEWFAAEVLPLVAAAEAG